MPHLKLEYTNNITQDIDFPKLFSSLHKVLSETSGIKIQNCKSRAFEVGNYYIAQGEAENAFVHLDVRFMEGRPPELKKDIGRKLLEILKTYFIRKNDPLNNQITVEISDIPNSSYFKHPEGTLTGR